MFHELTELLSYSFFLNSIIASLLASISCGIVGSYVYSKRMAFISGGITHASFGGIGIAYYFGTNPILGAVVFSVLSALGIEYLSTKSNVKEDSAIGIFWSLGMAIGIIFIYITPGYAPNLMSFLFGNILTVNLNYLIYMLILTIITVLFFVIFYYKILFIAFDEQYIRTHNVNVSFYKYVIICLIALSIVLNIKIAGVILVISYLTIPQATANIFTNSFKKLILFSILIAFIGSIIGLIFSYILNIPSGATIIISFTVIFLVSRLLKLLIIK